ncbi:MULTISPECIES: sugar ABC transporter permease [Cohnella]|uniref:Putative aldouronate transport system permease protein n=1 Tax=Cohnella phaseoli TaxID=456490 RepID=A0A3D9IUZ9_9BACL|nr:MULTISPECIES: ABC transporter permease subunit [Cohnella]RED65349.1 putative aldouronate transport system permease protein [Cohnella phaseoli]
MEEKLERKRLNGTSLRRELWNNRYLYLFVVPGVIWFLIFCYQPMYGVLIAFKDYDILEGVFASEWVGLANFKEFFNSPNFQVILTNSIAISLLKMLFGFPAPIILAILLNEVRNRVFKRVTQTISYLPFFVSWVVVAGIWYELFSTDGGVVNNLLVSLGVIKEPIFWFGNPDLFWGMVVASDIWKGIGFGTIIYLASIVSVNMDQYESAVIDGANRLRQIWHITLPAIRPTIILLFILNMAGILDAGFEQVYVFQNSMVLDKAEIIDTYVMKMGIFRAQYELATAVGVFKSIIGMMALFAVNFLVKKLGEDGIF